MAKVDATRNYGAEAVLAGVGFDEALALALARADETGATFLHAFEDPAVIAGQGTLGLELADDLHAVETFVLPIGGGGLASGIAIALRAGARRAPRRRQAGKRARDDRRRQRRKHRRADDSDPRRPPDDLVHVGDGRSRKRSRCCSSAPSSSSKARVRFDRRRPRGRRGREGRMLRAPLRRQHRPTMLISVCHGLTLASRYLVFRTKIADRPGSLVELLDLIAAEQAAASSVEHHREGWRSAWSGRSLADGDHARECTALSPIAALESRGTLSTASG